MTFRDISVDEMIALRSPLIVDVRAPIEYCQESIPGAFNVPLLNDEERVIVGTLFKSEGEVAARREALRIISPKIPTIVDQILALRKSRQSLVIHCWRGGLRSESVASFLSIIGVDCFRLVGGYKSWRRHVLQDLTADNYCFTLVLLDGLTGSGKTDLLHQLKEQGEATLDLEKLANHRGSVFGGIGLGKQPSQKDFESALWNELRTMGERVVFVEAEGRKIGRLSMPELLLNRFQQAKRVLVEDRFENRVKRILSDYGAGLNSEEKTKCLESLSFLKERIGGERMTELKRLAQEENAQAVVGILLSDYYDPLYIRQLKKYEPYQLTVSGETLSASARQIIDWRQTVFEKTAAQTNKSDTLVDPA